MPSFGAGILLLINLFNATDVYIRPKNVIQRPWMYICPKIMIQRPWTYIYNSSPKLIFVLPSCLRAFTVVAEVSNKSIFPVFTVRPLTNDRVKRK